MQAARAVELISVEDYLANECQSEARHEYIGGAVHAMAGASRAHNLIAGNLFAALHTRFRGGSCRVFRADLKLRLQIANTDIFYYPDVLVACDPRDTESHFIRYPTVLIEVLSPETERIDRREKFLSYVQIETLSDYVLVAQDKSEVTIFSRLNRWQPQVLSELEQVLRLPSLQFELPLSRIYEGVEEQPSNL